MRFIVTCDAWWKSDTQVEQPPELEAGLRLGGHCQESSIGFGVGTNLQKLSWSLSTCKIINSVMVILKPKAKIKLTFSKDITVLPVFVIWQIFKLLKFLHFYNLPNYRFYILSFDLDVGKGEQFPPFCWG